MSSFIPPGAHEGDIIFDASENVYKMYSNGVWTTVTYQYSDSFANPPTPYVENPPIISTVSLEELFPTTPQCIIAVDGIHIDNKLVISWDQLKELSDKEQLIDTIADKVLERLLSGNTEELLYALQSKLKKSKVKRFIEMMEEDDEDNRTSGSS